jgi:hypothetical protein
VVHGSSNDFSLALTSFCFKEGFALNAITGGSGKISPSVLFCSINFQCFLVYV